MKRRYINGPFISPLRVMLSPFSSFDRLREKKMGNLWQVLIQVAFFFLARVLTLVMSGFLFNTVRLEEVNLLFELLLISAVFLAFILSNWAFCVLTDGEGGLLEIALVAGFSLTPYSLCSLINMGLSNVFILREQPFMGIISAVGMLWSVLLCLIGLKTIHQFSMGRTLFSVFITLVFMALLAFLAVIVFSMTQQLLIFIKNIYNEIIFRT